MFRFRMLEHGKGNTKFPHRREHQALAISWLAIISNARTIAE